MRLGYFGSPVCPPWWGPTRKEVFSLCHAKSVVSVVCRFSPCYVQILVSVVCSFCLYCVQPLVCVMCHV